MILFSLHVLVSPKVRGDVLRGIGALLEPTRVAPGCLDCRLYGDVEEADAYLLIARWNTQAELDSYLGSQAGARLVAAMELALAPPVIRFDEIAHSGGLEVIEAARRARGLVQDWPGDAPEEPA
jgi:quinol monooxygenase YgiN